MIYGINNLKTLHFSMKAKVLRINPCEFSSENVN